MKLLVNKPISLTVRAEELEEVLAALKACSVRNSVHGDGETRTMVIFDQKITLPEDAMAGILEIFNLGSPRPIVLEYGGYGMTFELYVK